MANGNTKPVFRRALILSASVAADDGRLKLFEEIVAPLCADVRTIAYADSGHVNLSDKDDVKDDVKDVTPDKTDQHPVSRVRFLKEDCPKAPQRSISQKFSELFHMAMAHLPLISDPIKALSKRPACAALHKHAIDLAGQGWHPDLIVAKHWTVLPTALHLKREFGGVLWLDINEVMEDEHAHRFGWNVLYRPAIRRLMKRLNDFQGIAYTMTSFEQVKAQPHFEATYLPNYKPLASSSAKVRSGKPIRLLYHGLVLENRRLETVIKAIANSGRKDLELTIRGYGKPDLMNTIKQEAAKFCIDNQVIFEPPVANHIVADSATKHDVGLFVHNNDTLQLQLSEPNKVYEYVSAGLAVIATGTPVIQHVLGENGAGIFLDSSEPLEATLTQTLREITVDKVAKCQKASRILGKSLSNKQNIEAVQKRLIQTSQNTTGN